MSVPYRAVNAIVLQQHLEDAAVLRGTRSVLVRAPHVRLHQLQRLDERIAAHLDGLITAGAAGSTAVAGTLEAASAATLFVATAAALELRDGAALERCLAVAAALPEARTGVLSAFGWVSAPHLRGVTKALLDAPDPFRRALGLVACASHQVDPGAALTAAVDADDPALRSQALRVAGRLGRLDLLPVCLGALADPDAAVAHAAACAALLLGDRNAAPARLHASALAPGAWQRQSLLLLAMAVPVPQAHAVLQSLARDPSQARLLTHGIAMTGDPVYVPWLIKQMRDPAVARRAAEAFSMLTGLDLAAADLESDSPERVASGPDDDPADAEVALDEDDGLPWPHVERIDALWQAHGSRFAAGTRHFIGEPLSTQHGLSVLRTGLQRQRIAAAAHLCLLNPGTPLFNTAAPAWRQQRLLASMAT